MGPRPEARIYIFPAVRYRGLASLILRPLRYECYAPEGADCALEPWPEKIAASLETSNPYRSVASPRSRRRCPSSRTSSHLPQRPAPHRGPGFYGFLGLRLETSPQ